MWVKRVAGTGAEREMASPEASLQTHLASSHSQPAWLTASLLWPHRPDYHLYWLQIWEEDVHVLPGCFRCLSVDRWNLFLFFLLLSLSFFWLLFTFCCAYNRFEKLTLCVCVSAVCVIALCVGVFSTSTGFSSVCQFRSAVLAAVYLWYPLMPARPFGSTSTSKYVSTEDTMWTA